MNLDKSFSQTKTVQMELEFVAYTYVLFTGCSANRSYTEAAQLAKDK